MNARRNWKAALAAVLGCTLLAGCAAKHTTQSFARVQDSRVEASYVAVGADFGQYDRLSAEDMGIFFPTNSAPPVADQQRARKIFREAFIAQLGGYDVVQGEKGPTTLAVQASLIDFTNAQNEDVMSVGRQIRDVAKPGSIIFLMEMKDSESGLVLARAAYSAEIPPLSADSDVPTDWDAVEVAAQRWARLFREFLDENLKK